MTVIAWDGSLLVSDGRMTKDSSLVSDQADKIFKVKIKDFGTCVVGFAGDYSLIFPWMKHLEEKGVTEFTYEEDDECSAIVVNTKNECFEIYSSGDWNRAAHKTSIGSGSLIAQHFLLTGHDAVTAVKEAAKSELSCGGRITAYNSTTVTFTYIDPVEGPRSAVQSDSAPQGGKTAKTR